MVSQVSQTQAVVNSIRSDAVASTMSSDIYYEQIVFHSKAFFFFKKNSASI